MQPDHVRLVYSNSNIIECNFCTFGSVSNAAIMFQSRSRHYDVIRGFLRSLEANTGIIPEIRPHSCFHTRPFHFVIYLSQQSPLTIPTVVTVTEWRYPLSCHPESCHSSFQEWSDILTVATYRPNNDHVIVPTVVSYHSNSRHLVIPRMVT